MTCSALATHVIDDVAARLTDLVAHRPFRFRATRKDEARRYLDSLTRFTGFVPPDVQAWERTLHVRFPDVFRCFLLRMGRHSGELFSGADLWPRRLEVATWTRTLLASSPQLQLHAMDVVFLMHKGTRILYTRCAGDEDAPVFEFEELHAGPRLAAPSFAALLELQLQQLEREHVEAHARGGFLVSTDGSNARRIFPAHDDDALRPIDTADSFSDDDP